MCAKHTNPALLLAGVVGTANSRVLSTLILQGFLLEKLVQQTPFVN